MPGRANWLRISALCVGIFWLFWLPSEDKGLLAVYGFAVGISTLAIFRVHSTNIWRSWKPGYRFAGLGCIAGLLVTPVALLLMAFKSGLHGHITPDYSPGQIISVIRDLPFWMAGGGVLGFGLWLWISSMSRH